MKHAVDDLAISCRDEKLHKIINVSSKKQF